jgi:thiosulfate/3-mercaptopyruvate sulfurtransferase
VTYCQSGYRAAHSWLVLRLLGFGDVGNYLGSWYEWGNHPTTPVES